MHKVKRNKEPNSLKVKNKEWKDKFQENNTLKPDWSGFSKTVAKQHTLEALEEMYCGICCYCEGKIKSTSYPEIEHFKPKSKYPELCFEYSNLHYCCKRCNIAKGSDFDGKMINPSEDDPEDYIRYFGEIAISIENNERGNLMIEKVKMNQQNDLKNERLRYLNELTKNYELIVNSIEKSIELDFNGIELIIPFIEKFIEDIERKSKHGESYCTMVKHNFIEKIELLKAILLEF